MNNEILVSFCIISYNQEKYIKDAIIGAIHQEYNNMEIIISDDNSTDATYEIAQKICNEYKGNKKIILNKNSKNLGIAENVNTALYTLAKGEIVLLAGGDDISLPQRTPISVEYFNKFPQIMSLSFASQQVDVNLKSLDCQENVLITENISILTIEDYLRFKDFIIFSGDSRALRRSVIQKFEPIKIADAEDIYLFIRSLMLGSIGYIRKPMVKRRIHGSNRSLRKYTAKSKNMFIGQCKADISYALKNKYISGNIKIKLEKKIEYISHVFELNNYKPRKKILDLFLFSIKTLKYNYKKFRNNN